MGMENYKDGPIYRNGEKVGYKNGDTIYGADNSYVGNSSQVLGEFDQRLDKYTESYDPCCGLPWSNDNQSEDNDTSTSNDYYSSNAGSADAGKNIFSTIFFLAGVFLIYQLSKKIIPFIYFNFIIKIPLFSDPLSNPTALLCLVMWIVFMLIGCAIYIAIRSYIIKK